ncbi:MAG: hypothetical protein LBQ75_04975 [Zoogloeaceae bacterium]|jgi:hypothetical protein|nr:hypothetical protein [Zoogloeaceae bacterium]
MSLLRILIFFVLGWIVWRLLRPAARNKVPRQPAKEISENMAACVWCGIYVPESEMVQDRKGQKFCCQAHLSLDDTKKRAPPS